MTSWTRYLGCVTFAAFLLTGCGTTIDENADEPQEDSVKEGKEGNTSQEDNRNNRSDNKVRLMEQNLQYTINGEAKEKTAFLKKSDNQPFSLYVLQQFRLSAEEPGKDIVFLTEDDSIYMRIELLKADVNWDEVEKNVQAQLKSISETIRDPSLDVEGGTGFEVESGDDVITSILLKDEKAPVRLTIFTKKDRDYRDAFLEMAKTLMKG
ncbi:hypothetical protein P4646_00655 [Peribacillus simplex]|uniref:hypothetical protein n=1 Tax=Peribacillus simplex TaxID=1478 RepID=UPI0011DD230B|nr:hypothetical protein [Peribacillus simplex]MED3982595.1 hypothetical protein [Peribacillus simplex]MED4095928.1 hypothetical protein [Peribacillus simplex]CAH0155456.1 hypothetical protein SRABI84_00806 [Peribacillus simplex]